MLERGYGYTTLELKVNYVRPLTDKTGPVRAGRIGQRSGRSAWPRGGWSTQPAACTPGSTTCLIFPLPAKAP